MQSSIGKIYVSSTDRGVLDKPFDTVDLLVVINEFNKLSHSLFRLSTPHIIEKSKPLSFRIEENPKIASAWGITDSTLIPNRKEMEFYYTLMSKFFFKTRQMEDSRK